MRLRTALWLLDVSAGGTADFWPMQPRHTLVLKSRNGTTAQHKFLGREKVGGVDCSVFENDWFLFGQNPKLYVSTDHGEIRLHKVDGAGTRIAFKPAMIVLKKSLPRGTQWEQRLALEYESLNISFDAKVTHRVEGVERVRTPAGDFTCLKIATGWDFQFGGQATHSEQIVRYAPGIGIIQSETSTRAGGIAAQEFDWTLQRIER
jgi:hypothetical protein